MSVPRPWFSAILVLSGCGTYHPDRTVAPSEIAIEVPQEADAPAYTLLVGITEVSQREYLAIAGTNPAAHSDCPDCPVERVSWYDAARYANARSAEAGLEPCYELTDCAVRPADEDERFRERRHREVAIGFECAGAVSRGPTCSGYRLPTRRESWAYRDPSRLRTRPRELRRWVNFGQSGAGASTFVVGTLEPDEHGLHDVFGNVEEWLDAPSSEPDDATGFRRGETRWQTVAGGCLFSNRRSLRREEWRVYPAAFLRTCVGFRLVRTAPTPRGT